jgi:hypothetical protein
MAFDKGILKYKRFFFSRGKKDIKTFGAMHHEGGLGGQVPGRTEIGQNPLFQILGLSHIDDLFVLIFEDIDSRSLREIAPKGFGIQIIWGEDLHFLRLCEGKEGRQEI